MGAVYFVAVANYYSLFAIHYSLFTIHYSLFTPCPTSHRLDKFGKLSYFYGQMSTAPRTNSSLEFQLNRAVASLFRERASGRKVTYAELLSDKMLIIAAIRIGIPYSLFELILKYTPFSETDWASFLNISTKSLHRYKETSRTFKPIQSEKIIEMAEVTKVGVDVFGDMNKFKLWLETPNYSLGSLKPMELLKDSYGKEMVISELTRINFGILA